MKKITALILCIAMAFSQLAFVHANEEKPFLHPGVLNTAVDLERIAQAVKNKEQPIYDGWNMLLSSSFSSPNQSDRATETIVRGGNGQNFGQLYQDCAKAYQNALRYHIEGNEECGKTACRILNAWSEKLKTVTGNADRYLAAGIYSTQLAAASELMRDHPDFEKERMQSMLIDVFYEPLSERFLISNEYGTDHNGACITNYWSNWDLCNMAATVAIGIFCDRRDIYDTGIEYFKNGAGNGSLYNAIPHLFDGSLAQQQESGRDQGHATLAIMLLGYICEMAWNQGNDLYSWGQNRLMYAAEYMAAYNNNNIEVPFEMYEWGNGVKGDYKNQTVVSNAGRPASRPIWALFYNHYVTRMGYECPNIKKAMEQTTPDGGPGGHASTFDQLGFSTLLYTNAVGNPDGATPLSGNVEEGVYKISPRHSGKYISQNGDSVAQYASLGSNEWEIAHLGGGVYTITNTQSGKSLGIENSSHDPLAKLVCEDYTAENSQKFAFIETGDGFYRITAIHASKALDVLDVSKDDGASLIQYRYLGSDNQKFSLELVEKREVTPPENKDADRIRITYNGIRIEGDTEPVIENGRMLVPLRLVFEKTGAEVSWDDASKSASCTLDGITVIVTSDSTVASINGEEITLDVSPRLVNNRVLVPLRFISEALGATVTWRESTKTAEILL